MIQHFFLQNISILIWEDFYHIAVHYSPNKMSTYPCLSYESDIWKGESRQENMGKQILSITSGCGDLTKGRVDPGSTKITYVLLVSLRFFFFPYCYPQRLFNLHLIFNLNSLKVTTKKNIIILPGFQNRWFYHTQTQKVPLIFYVWKVSSNPKNV